MLQSFLSWIITAIFGYITFYLIKFYWNLKQYPNGPIPIPFLGNILIFRGEKSHPMQSFMSLCRKYGSVYTFWMGSDPYVFIFDIELAKEAFNKNELTGRPQTLTAKMVCNSRGNDVIYADYGKSWESLRRVTHLAVRKYAVSKRLAHLVSELIDETVKNMIKTEGIGNPFNPSEYIELAIYNIIASSAFGKKYTFTDPEFVRLKKIINTFFGLGDKLALIQFVPILRIPLRSYVKTYEKHTKDYINVIKNKFNEHIDSYEKGVIRDFADALIAAKNEALAEGKESAPYLTDHNLSLALWNLFIAGLDSSQFTLQWMLLLMANYTDVQQKLRQEIDGTVGDRMAIQEDMNNCHYVMAFIAETLRFRNIVPLGIPHKTVVDCQIGGHKIPANTSVLLHQFSILNNHNYWSEPEVFRPERFIENGIYVKVRPQSFIPFGIGRRKCLGEKLALSDIFLVLVRFLQSTNGLCISLPKGSGSADLEPNPDSVVIFSYPKPYDIVFNKTN